MSENKQSHFIVPVKYYVRNLLALMALTILTVITSRIHIGDTGNIILALFIAGVKATLVVTIFMGVKWDRGFSKAAVITSIFCVLIFFAFTFSDVFVRGTIYKQEQDSFGIKSPVKLVSPNSTRSHHE